MDKNGYPTTLAEATHLAQTGQKGRYRRQQRRNNQCPPTRKEAQEMDNPYAELLDKMRRHIDELPPEIATMLTEIDEALHGDFSITIRASADLKPYILEALRHGAGNLSEAAKGHPLRSQDPNTRRYRIQTAAGVIMHACNTIDQQPAQSTDETETTNGC